MSLNRIEDVTHNKEETMHTITIKLHSDVDPSEILELAQELALQLAQQLEDDYDDCSATVFEDEVCVETE